MVSFMYMNVAEHNLFFMLALIHYTPVSQNMT